MLSVKSKDERFVNYHDFLNNADELLKLLEQRFSSQLDIWHTTSKVSLEDLYNKEILTLFSTTENNSLDLTQNGIVEKLEFLKLKSESVHLPFAQLSRKTMYPREVRKLLNSLLKKSVDISAPYTPPKDTPITPQLKGWAHKKYTIVYIIKNIFARFKSLIPLKRNPAGAHIPLRSFNNKGFLYTQILFPIEDFLIQEFDMVCKTFSNSVTEVSTLLDKEKNIIQVKESYLKAKEASSVRAKTFFSQLAISIPESCSLAGTPRLKNASINKKRSLKIFSHQRKRYLRTNNFWPEYINAIKLNIEKDIELLQLNARTRLLLDNWNSDITNNFITELNKRFSLARTEIIAIQSSLKDINNLSGDQKIRTVIRQKKMMFYDRVTTKILIPASEVILEYNFPLKVSQLNRSLLNSVDALKEKYGVFKIINSELLHPEYKLEFFSIGELVNFYLKDEAIPQITEVSSGSRDTIIALANDVNLLASVIDTTFDSALADLKLSISSSEELSNSDSLIDALNESIERTLKNIKEIERSFTAVATDLNNQLHTILTEFSDHTSGLQASEKITQLRLSLAKVKTEERYTKTRRFFKRYTQKSTLWVGRIVKSINQFLLTYLSKFLNFFSKTTRLDLKVNPGQQYSIQNYLRDTRSKVTALPIIYQRLFDFTPLSTPKVFIRPESEIEQIKESFSEWLKGRTGLVSVVGDKGTGRSTLLTMASQELFSKSKVITLQNIETILTEDVLLEYLSTSLKIKGHESLESLEDFIIDSEENFVVIFDDVHRMFLKSIAGISILNRFLLFSARTQDNIFWVVSCGYFTWNYLDKILKLSSYFRKVITIESLNSEKIEQLILARHELSGIPVKFFPNESIKRQKGYKKLTDTESRQSYLSAYFFDKLAKTSAGNVSVAMLIWLISIKKSTNQVIQVSTSPEIINAISHNFTDDELFVLSTIIHHESISKDELSVIFNIPVSNSLLLLTGLTNKGILIDKKGSYELHFFIYKSVVKVLQDKRFLH